VVKSALAATKAVNLILEKTDTYQTQENEAEAVNL